MISPMNKLLSTSLSQFCLEDSPSSTSCMLKAMSLKEFCRMLLTILATTQIAAILNTLSLIWLTLLASVQLISASTMKLLRRLTYSSSTWQDRELTTTHDAFPDSCRRCFSWSSQTLLIICYPEANRQSKLWKSQGKP